MICEQCKKNNTKTCCICKELMDKDNRTYTLKTNFSTVDKYFCSRCYKRHLSYYLKKLIKAKTSLERGLL